MKLTSQEYELILNKLEYRFKKSNDPMLEKLKNHDDLSKENVEFIMKKLEYNFKKSGNSLIEKLKNFN